jgi:hypothetical protein
MSKAIERAADALAFMETVLLALPQTKEKWRFQKAIWGLDLYLTGRTGARMGDEPDVFHLLGRGDDFDVHLSDGGRSRILLQAGGPDQPPIVLDRNVSGKEVIQKWDKLMEFVRQRGAGGPPLTK